MAHLKEQGLVDINSFDNKASRSQAVNVWLNLDVSAGKNEKIKEVVERYLENIGEDLNCVYWLPIIKTGNTEHGSMYQTSSDKELTKDNSEGFVYLSNSEVQVLFDELSDHAFEKLGDKAEPLLDKEIELAAQKVMNNHVTNHSDGRVVVMSIFRFDRLVKGSEFCLYIGENTSDEEVRSALAKYVMNHKDDIVENTAETPVGENSVCFKHTRERLFNEIMGHINHGLPIDSMTQYWRIPDGFDENMDHVNSYIRMRFQALVRI